MISLKKILRKIHRYILHKLNVLMVGEIYPKAITANRHLYADVDSIPSEDLQKFRSNLMHYCEARGYSKKYTDDWLAHTQRLLLSVQCLSDIKGNPPSDYRAIETGSPCVVSDLLKHYMPEIHWENTASDLRYRWDFPDEYADLITSMEVIEHLSDIPKGYQDGFFKTGASAFLKEAFRVLKKNGILFITTPNAASILQVSQVLLGDNPWFFPLHVREYTLQEVKDIVVESGFEIMDARTIHCLSVNNRQDFSPLFKLLIDNHYSIKDRGDDIFLTARKP